MAFEGWLLKINGIAFPTRLIAAESLKITPDLVHHPAVLKEYPVFLFRDTDSGYVEAVQ